jgi:polar amino acid transport system substrate-binding protein
MTCRRWEEVDFSAEYYTAHQKFLVRSDSDISDRGDLEGRTVCVTNGSTSETIMSNEVPAAELLPVEARTDCLAALQLGEADAYFGHDTFLNGMLAQDPTVEVRDLLDPDVTVSHYGIAVNRQHPELTRFVNSALEDIINRGRWDELVARWLTPPDAPAPVPPEPDYRRAG